MESIDAEFTIIHAMFDAISKEVLLAYAPRVEKQDKVAEEAIHEHCYILALGYFTRSLSMLRQSFFGIRYFLHLFIFLSMSPCLFLRGFLSPQPVHNICFHIITDKGIDLRWEKRHDAMGRPDE